MEQNITLTELEQKVLRWCINEGFFYDYYRAEDLDKQHSYFLAYEVEGRKERGALSSLVKKGILNVYHDEYDGDCVYSNKNTTPRQILELAGIAY